MVLDLLKLLLRGPGSMWSNQNLFIGSAEFGAGPECCRSGAMASPCMQLLRLGTHVPAAFHRPARLYCPA